MSDSSDAVRTASVVIEELVGKPSHEEWLKRFPLSVQNGQVMDALGQRFRLKGVNWYGASDMEHVVGGLHERRVEDLAETIASMGFTVVRLPFSNQMMRPGVKVREGAINFILNPHLEGKTPLEVFDVIVNALGNCMVAVIPNNHCSFGAWGGDVDANGLWFCADTIGDSRDEYTEEQFFADWRSLAQRYKRVPWVVGYDLRNEVRPVPTKARVKWPVWGETKGVVPSLFFFLTYHDWRAAAGKAARGILEEDPDKLIVLERIVLPAQSLESYVRSPPDGVPANRLVFAVHSYAWTGPGIYIPSFHGLGGWNERGWKKNVQDFVRGKILGKNIGGTDETRNFQEMSRDEQLNWHRTHWGYLLEDKRAPVWVSEFGLPFNANERERAWYETLVHYINEFDGDFAYWPFNGPPKPNGGDEKYGLVGRDWLPIDSADWRLRLMME